MPSLAAWSNLGGQESLLPARTGIGPNVLCWSCDPASNISEVVTAIRALSGQTYLPPFHSLDSEGRLSGSSNLSMRVLDALLLRL